MDRLTGTGNGKRRRKVREPCQAGVVSVPHRLDLPIVAAARNTSEMHWQRSNRQVWIPQILGISICEGLGLLGTRYNTVYALTPVYEHSFRLGHEPCLVE